ncbi:2Fe-2S iron-sulfur cluster-binding protein [Actinomycetes bacterium M1A6_2h]
MTERTTVTARTLRLQIEGVVDETSDAVTVTFGGSLDYQPGQFLTLEIPHEPGTSVARCYSLSSSPHTDVRPAISIKRTAGGHASNWLCDNATAGLTLSALQPAGTFVPARWDRHLLLVAAGSGITPIMSILKTALTAHDGTVTVIYANRSPNSVMFASTLAELERQYPSRLTVRHWFEAEHGLPTENGLGDLIGHAPDADAYLCGPEPFMDLAHSALLTAGLSPDGIHREVFSSIQTNPFVTPLPLATPAPPGPASTAVDAGTPVTAQVEGEAYSFHCPPDTLLLDAMLDQGIDAPFVCREGTCGACAFTLVAGDVDMRANDTLDDYELGKGMRLACQSVPRSDHLDIVIE